MGDEKKFRKRPVVTEAPMDLAYVEGKLSNPFTLSKEKKDKFIQIEMIDTFGLKNFKAFKDSGILELAPITLLYGPNSSGKSSLIQSLMILSQTERGGINEKEELTVDGSIWRAESFSDLIHKQKKISPVSFSFSTKRLEPSEAKFRKGSKESWITSSKGPKIEFSFKYVTKLKKALLMKTSFRRKILYFSEDNKKYKHVGKNIKPTLSTAGYFSMLSLKPNSIPYRDRLNRPGWKEKEVNLSWTRSLKDIVPMSERSKKSRKKMTPQEEAYEETKYQVIEEAGLKNSDLWWLDYKSVKEAKFLVNLIARDVWESAKRQGQRRKSYEVPMLRRREYILREENRFKKRLKALEQKDGFKLPSKGLESGSEDEMELREILVELANLKREKENISRNKKEQEKSQSTPLFDDENYKFFQDLVTAIVCLTPLERSSSTRPWPTATKYRLPPEFFMPFMDYQTFAWLDLIAEMRSISIIRAANKAAEEFLLYFSPRDSETFDQNLRFIGPLRGSPQRVYGLSSGNPDSIGASEDAWVNMLSHNLDLQKRVALALESLSGYKIEVSKIDLFKAAEVRLKEPRFDLSLSPSETGFGFSQVLPILVEGLSAQNKLICLEQPETHIHPAFQAKLADFFVNTSFSDKNLKGNNWLIETHSELIALRVLKKIRNGDIPLDSVAFYYCDNKSDGSTLKKLRVNESGVFLDAWPRGFFEESFNETFD